MNSVLGGLRVRLNQLRANRQACVDGGEGLGKSLLAGEQAAKVVVGRGQVALVV
jgi:hypothetical protein